LQQVQEHALGWNLHGRTFIPFWTKFARSCPVSLFAIALAMFMTSPLCGQTAHYSSAQRTVFSGAHVNGVAVDADGNLYIADYGNGRVVRAPANDLSCSRPDDCITVASGLQRVDQIAVDGNGNVYIPNGTVVVKVPWTGSGYGVQSTVVAGLSEPSGVAVDGAGNVYVADRNDGRVIKVPWTGSGYGAQVTVTSGLIAPNGLALDRTGNLYIVVSEKVVKAAWTGSGYGAPSPIGGSWTWPQSVAVDALGNVYVADYYQLFKVPWTGSSYGTSIAMSAYDSWALVEGVAVDGSGNVYFSDYDYQKVVEISQFSVDFAGVGVGTTTSAISVPFTFDTAGSLNNTTPYKVLTQGATALDFGDAGGSTCQANQAYNAGDSCYVNVTFSPRVAGQRMGAVILQDASGNVVATAYLHGIGLGPQVAFGPGTRITASSVTAPGAVAVDEAGNLYICDVPNGQVVKVPRTGSDYGMPAPVASGLSGPYGVAVDGGGNVYIAATVWYSGYHRRAAAMELRRRW
jgi:sugar lactone lactonase YvrE